MNENQFKHLVYQEISEMLGALAEPRRIEIVELLCQCERNVESLAEVLGVGVTTVSHHLQVLKRARLARDRKVGRRVYYSATQMAVSLWRSVSDVAGRELVEVRYAMDTLLAGDAESGAGGTEAVDMDELQRRVAAGEAVLVDVRPEEEYAAGHLPGAFSVSIDRLEERIGEIPQGKPVYAYCRGRYCVLSHEAARVLAQHGYSVSALPEGIAEWRSDNMPLETVGAGAPADEHQPK